MSARKRVKVTAVDQHLIDANRATATPRTLIEYSLRNISKDVSRTVRRRKPQRKRTRSTLVKESER